MTGSNEMLEAEANSVIEGLGPLFTEARAKNHWFFAVSPGIWFSPDELECENKHGKYRWDATCWELRDPVDELEALNLKVADAQAARDRFAARLASA